MLTAEHIKTWNELLKSLAIKPKIKSGAAASSSDSGALQSITEQDRVKILNWCKKNISSSINNPSIEILQAIFLKYSELNSKASLSAVVDDKLGYTVLHEAAKSGFDRFISHALAKCDDVLKEMFLKIKSKVGNTALHLSALMGSFACTESLLVDEADVNLFNNAGKLPIHFALASFGQNGATITDRKACFMRLLDKTNPEYLVRKDDTGSSLLIDLVQFNDLLLIEAVVAKNPDVLKLSDRLGQNPLHKAIIHNADNLIDYFTQHHELLTAITANGSTVLHLACRYADEGVISKLMNAEPLQELLWSRDEHGKMAFEYLETKANLVPLYNEFKDKCPEQSSSSVMR